MKYTILILLALTVIACSEPKQRRVYACDCNQKAKVALDIKESIKNANNMSDEEMEDVIHQLELTYVRMHCGERMVNGMQHDGWYEITETDTTYTYYQY
jgi:hypothetical protein